MESLNKFVQGERGKGEEGKSGLSRGSARGLLCTAVGPMLEGTGFGAALATVSTPEPQPKDGPGPRVRVGGTRRWTAETSGSARGGKGLGLWVEVEGGVVPGHGGESAERRRAALLTRQYQMLRRAEASTAKKVLWGSD